jgi:peptide/nickel transport system substrate-binding protein
MLAGCSNQPPPSNAAPGTRHAWTQPGVLRVAVVQEPKNLNPILAATTVDIFADRLMFEPLLTADPLGNPLPMLATQVPLVEDGSIGKDGLRVVYHLRRDARWSDGVPVTSHDVKWTWQAIMNPRNDVISRNGYDDVRSIDTPDDYTVVVHLKERSAPFVNTFFAESDQPYAVLPEHVLAKYPDLNQLPFDREPSVVDGPFRFVSWSHGDRIELAANPSFFMGPPKLDRVTIQIVPDENASIALLKTHAIDYMFEASTSNYPVLNDMPDVKIVFVDMNGYEALQFNVSRPGISDARVRRAIAYAIDKQSIVDRVTHSQANVATEDLPDWMWAYDPDVKSYPYDPQRSKALLEDAGWTIGPDGVARKDGQPLALIMVTDNVNATHREESLLLQEVLRKIGIQVQLKYFPQAILYESAKAGGILEGGNFDLTLVPWFAGVDPDDSTQLLCGMIPPNGENVSRYCTADMDAAQHVALTSYDQATRKAAYSRIQHILARDNPYIYLWWTRVLQAISVDFKGFSPNPGTESWNAWQWSI